MPDDTPEPGSAGDAARVGWVDTAKGLGAALIVLGHSAAFSAVAGIDGPWYWVANQFASFPLPVFFFAAGVVGAGPLTQGLGVVVRRRVAPLLWVYLVWSLLSMFTLGLGRIPHPLLRVAELLTRPDPNMWFVYALALYFLAAWALRRVSVWLQLAPAVGIAAAFGTGGPWCPPGDQALGKAALGFVVFLLGVRFAAEARRAAARVRTWHAVVLPVLYVGAALLVPATPLRHVLGSNVLVSLVAVAAGVTLATVLSRGRPGAALQHLGRRSLPVYLIQFFPATLVPRMLAPVLPMPAAGLLLPPVLAVFALLVALLVHRATTRIPGLYTLPAPLARLLEVAVLDVSRRAKRREVRPEGAALLATAPIAAQAIVASTSARPSCATGGAT